MAQNQLEACAHAIGLREIHFQYEPIAAAFDYEARLTHEGLVLVADIGGGTSDFSLVRVGPERAKTSRSQARRARPLRRARRGHRFRPARRTRDDPARTRLPIDRSGRARVAQSRVFRPRDVASDQHGVRAEARRRIAIDAPSLHRRAPPRAADARRRPAARPCAHRRTRKRRRSTWRRAASPKSIWRRSRKRCGSRSTNRN